MLPHMAVSPTNMHGLLYCGCKHDTFYPVAGHGPDKYIVGLVEEPRRNFVWDGCFGYIV